MKKTLFSIIALAGLSSMMFITSCSKDDTAAPVVTVTGDESVTVSLNGTYTEQGATATDEKDGTIATVTSDYAAGTNPNEDLTGTYTITYSAQDAAGNVGTATRTVIVKNDAEAIWAGTYDGTEVDINGPYTYVQSNIVTASTTVNNQIFMTRLGDFANNTVYMNIVGSNISMPTQTHTNVGTGTNSCDVHDRRSDGVGTKTSTGFGLTYNDEKLAPCSGTRTNVVAAFIKQ